MSRMTGLITEGLSSPAWFAALEAAPRKNDLAFGNLPDGRSADRLRIPQAVATTAMPLQMRPQDAYIGAVGDGRLWR